MKIFHQSNGTLIVLDTAIDKDDTLETFKNATKKSSSYTLEFTNNIMLQRPMMLYLLTLLNNDAYTMHLIVHHPFLSNYFSKLKIAHDKQFNTYIQTQQKSQIFKVVLLAGSAGSFEKIMQILRNIPQNECSFIIVQHISEDAIARLDTIIENKTQHKATYFKDGTLILPGMVYIAPPGHQCIIENGTAYLRKSGKVNYAQPSIEVTLHSLVQHYHHQLAAILLCGYGDDGAAGLNEAIRSYKSTIIAMNPQECGDAGAIPKAAIQNTPDIQVMGTREIISFLEHTLILKQHRLAKVRTFLKEIMQVYGYDFQQYQIESIIRRIDIAKHKQGFESDEAFFHEVLQNKLAFTKLFFEFSINVTQFFRQPNSYEEVKNTALPRLDDYAHLKIWCAGVSSGEEAYTLANLLHEHDMLKKSYIYATDFNPYILQVGKNGLYAKEQIDAVELGSKERTGHFHSLFDIKGNVASVKNEILKQVHFFVHNMATDASFGEFQLIICKNVLIYFNESLQQRVLQLFYDSLSLDGYLVLGQSESLPQHGNNKLFSVVEQNAKLFKKVV